MELQQQGGQDLDAQARAAGYPDYATMQAFMMHRSQSLRENTTTQVPGPQGNVLNHQQPVQQRPAAAAPQSFMQRLMDAFSSVR